MTDTMKILTGRAVLSSLSAAASQAPEVTVPAQKAAPIMQGTAQDEQMAQAGKSSSLTEDTVTNKQSKTGNNTSLADIFTGTGITQNRANPPK